MEAGDASHGPTIAAVVRALESAGVIFVEENGDKTRNTCPNSRLHVPAFEDSFPSPQDDEPAEWRVRLDGHARVVLVFDMVGMDWSGLWEDTGRPLAQWEIRAAAALPMMDGRRRGRQP